MGAVALVLVELLPRQLITLFGAANESAYYTDFAVRSFRIYLCMIILACVNKAYQNLIIAVYGSASARNG